MFSPMIGTWGERACAGMRQFAAGGCSGGHREQRCRLPEPDHLDPRGNGRGAGMTRISPKGDIAAGMSVMLMLSVLLSWIPGLGTLVAGIVGGRVASGFTAAFLASLLPGLLIGVLLFFLATLLSGMPLIGVIAGMGGLALAGTQVAALLVGAMIGGLLAG